jgi:tagatose 1,6-diphosphate aldolase
MAFAFLDPGPLTDRELELVPPDARWIEALLDSCRHPECRSDPAAVAITRSGVVEFLKESPGGRYPGDPAKNRVPAYHFWMRVATEPLCKISIVGHIGLRIGSTTDLERYFGHIGYNVYVPARGRHFAERACRLLFPLARAHGMSELWITCNPENVASRRTCERLGGELIEIVDLPADNGLYQRGERRKCRYRIGLNTFNA